MGLSFKKAYMLDKYHYLETEEKLSALLLFSVRLILQNKYHYLEIEEELSAFLLFCQGDLTNYISGNLQWWEFSAIGVS